MGDEKVVSFLHSMGFESRKPHSPSPIETWPTLPKEFVGTWLADDSPPRHYVFFWINDDGAYRVSILYATGGMTIGSRGMLRFDGKKVAAYLTTGTPDNNLVCELPMLHKHGYHTMLVNGRTLRNDAEYVQSQLDYKERQQQEMKALRQELDALKQLVAPLFPAALKSPVAAARDRPPAPARAPSEGASPPQPSASAPSLSADEVEGADNTTGSGGAASNDPPPYSS